jgi:hypothetical protein
LEFDVKGRDENRSESTIKIEIIVKILGEQMLESSSFVFGSSKCHQFLPQAPKGMSAQMKSNSKHKTEQQKQQQPPNDPSSKTKMKLALEFL